jgi:RHH-type transcriptional regulator, rel operon repressor / antitoxin RelB
MPKTTTMTVRVSPQVSERLAALAHGTKRSKAYLASAAIADFVERNAWQVARITAALEDARSGRPGIPREPIEAWMASWGTDKELPRPRAKR